MRYSIIVLSVFLLVVLAGCGGECSEAADCAPRPHFTAACVDSECQYQPIPNECGNNQCEAQADENKCTCPQDCGQCSGPVPGSEHLVQMCIAGECSQDVSGQPTPVVSSNDVRSAGDTFKIETEYNTPFNVKRDVATFTIMLSQLGRNNENHEVTSIELSGMTDDRRTITLGRKEVGKHVWAAGDSITEELILDFPSAESEGTLRNLELVVNYNYEQVTGTRTTERQASVKNRMREELVFVKPTATYACPDSCDDGNPGTRDTCGAQTDFFCQHEPIPNACGNFVCDSRETKCSCPQDCGPCSGSAGEYLEYTCQANQCATEVKPGITVQPSSLFDERSLGPVQLNNNFKYNDPFNIKTDAFELDFAIYRKDPTVGEVAIETVRLLEGQQQIAEASAEKTLGESATTIRVEIPSLASPEEERTVSLGVWYRFTQDGKEKRGNYNKPLGKITFINPQ